MNNARRKELQKAISLVEEATEIIENVLEEEDEARYNTPENLIQSLRYQKLEENCGSMYEAINSLCDCLDSLSEVVEG